MNTQVSQLFDETLRPLKYGVLFDDSGLQVYPDTAALTVTRGENTPIVLGDVPVIDPDTGETQYNWTAADSAALTDDVPGFNNRARWTFTKGADTFERAQYFDVVFADLRSRIEDSDLIEIFPPLDAARKNYSGKATGGTLSTIIDTGTLTAYPAEFFRSGIISFVTGANRGRSRPIIQFDAANSTITVSPAFNFSVDSGDTYKIASSYNAQIGQAWRQIFSRAVEWFDREAAGRLLDGVDFSQPHLFLSLAMAAETLIQGKEDQYSIAAARFKQDYEKEAIGLKVKLDTSSQGDGSIIDTRIQGVFWGK